MFLVKYITMGTRKNTTSLILDSLRNTKEGQLLFPGDFLNTGTPEAVNMAFFRLASEKKLIRLGKGIYLHPKMDPVLGLLYPSLEEIAHKIAAKEKVLIRPTGAYALNRLGFSTQVPTKVVFLTNGSPRKIKIGKGTITFKRTTPKKMASKGELTFLAIQALNELGENNIGSKEIDRLVDILKKEEVSTIREDAKYAPNWIARILYYIADKIEKNDTVPAAN